MMTNDDVCGYKWKIATCEGHILGNITCTPGQENENSRVKFLRSFGLLQHFALLLGRLAANPPGRKPFFSDTSVMYV